MGIKLKSVRTTEKFVEATARLNRESTAFIFHFFFTCVNILLSFSYVFIKCELFFFRFLKFELCIYGATS